MPSLILPFLLTVAACVAGVILLAGLFVTLSPWVQRHLSGLFKDLDAKNRP